MATKKTPKAALNIGPSRDAIVAARAAIMEIVKAPAGDKVKCQALSALWNICKVEGATVMNCTFTG